MYLNPNLAAGLSALILGACTTVANESFILDHHPYDKHFVSTGAQFFTLEDKVLTAIVGQNRGHAKLLVPYDDFYLRVKIWVEDGDTNSGIYIRCQDIEAISSNSCYEFNISDNHATPANRTGAILDRGAPMSTVTTAGQWSSIGITAKKNHLSFTINGEKTADIIDDTYSSGHIAFQYGGKDKLVKFKDLFIHAY